MEDISKIILGTGSYDNVKSGNTVSITGDGGISFGYNGPAYKKLAPKLVTYTPYKEKLDELNKIKKDLTDINEYYRLRKEIEDEYINSYYDIRLKELNMYKLMNLLYHKYGENIILLCHEPIDEFCHRRVLADYIELETGVYIPEISVDEEGNINKLLPIRYKHRLQKVIKSKKY